MCVLSSRSDNWLPGRFWQRLNQVEIELSVLSRQCLEQRIPEVEILKSEIIAWKKARNQERTSVSWRFQTFGRTEETRTVVSPCLTLQSLFGEVLDISTSQLLPLRSGRQCTRTRSTKRAISRRPRFNWSANN